MADKPHSLKAEKSEDSEVAKPADASAAAPKAEKSEESMVAKPATASAAASKLDDIGVSSETKDNHPAVSHAVRGVVESAAVPATAHLEDHPVFEPTREVC